MKFLNIKTLLLIVSMLEVANCAERLEEPFLEELNKISRVESKEMFGEEFLKFLNTIEKLNEGDRKSLYLSTVEGLDPSPEGLSFDSHRWSLIGAILLHAESKDLIYDILIKTPPPRVGFVSLGQFMEHLPPEVVAQVIRDGAYDRSKLQKK